MAGFKTAAVRGKLLNVLNYSATEAHYHMIKHCSANVLEATFSNKSILELEYFAVCIIYIYLKL